MYLVSTITCIFVVDMLYMLLLYNFFYRFSIRQIIPHISTGRNSGNCCVRFLVCNANEGILHLFKKQIKFKNKTKKRLNTKKREKKKLNNTKEKSNPPYQK